MNRLIEACDRVIDAAHGNEYTCHMYSVRIMSSFARVVLAAAKYRKAHEALQIANGAIQAAGTAGFDDSVRKSSVACARMESARSALFAALDAAEAEVK